VSERADKRRVLQHLAVLLEIFRVEMTDVTIQAWYQGVADLPEDLLLEALVDLRKAERMPKPSEVHERARPLLERRREEHRAMPAARPSPEEQAAVRSQIHEFIAKLSEQKSAGARPRRLRSQATLEAEVQRLRALDAQAKRQPE